MTTSPSTQPLVWFITGTSQGFGHELVRAALQRGDSVVATSRQPEKVAAKFPEASDRLLAISMDLHDESHISSVVETAVKRFGRIDVLVNNAGHGLLGAVEEASDAEVTSVYETNVFGLLRVTRAVLPHLRRQKSGHIINLSSIGGLVGLPGWGIYNSTKFAVEGLSEAMALELAHLNIRVTAIEPGPFRTDFLGGSLVQAEEKLPDYDASVGKTRTYAQDNNGSQAGDPALAADAIIQVVTSEKPPMHLLLGALAYKRAEAKLADLQHDFDTWRGVGLATDYTS
jgi:NAD(P)-dependent dehydrogenase (short-subunit alcohol dehydrogenase family)